jgi:hypothetical protein
MANIPAVFQNRKSVLTLAHSNETRRTLMLTPLCTRFFQATLATLAVSALGCAAHAQYVSREQDVVNLRLGQRVLVDDGTCPAGQVKQLSGSKMTATGVVVIRKCVPRPGSKKTGR